MMGHVLFPAVDNVPASFSRRWVTQYLREQLDFRGVIFADDLTMEGATVMGGVVARAEAALDAGCDVLPVCNRRASVVELLDGLKVKPGPASQIRILRMRGREAALAHDVLTTSAEYLRCRDWLQRCERPPELVLE
jgi:beta-N-acetylhexosaminidase